MSRNPRKAALAAAVALSALTVGGAMPTASAAVGTAGNVHRCTLPRFGPGSQYRPVIHPANFTAHVDNAWFPLPVGAAYVYSGRKDGQRAIDVVQVSRRTRRIDGVRTRVVNDRLLLNGVLEERTSDYYSEDRCGTVWYFGEDTATLDRHGHVVDRSGSFHAGVNGAQPGVYMQAHPRVGRRFRQEWYRGQAEDRYRALSKHARFTSRFVTTRRALLTQERTALEPGVVDHKYYVRGVGTVDERTVRGGHEHLELVAVLR